MDRQTDRWTEGQAHFHWLLDLAVPRLGHGHPSLTESAAQPLPMAEIWRSKGPTCSLLSLAYPPHRLQLTPNPTSHTHTTHKIHTHTLHPQLTKEALPAGAW